MPRTRRLLGNLFEFEDLGAKDLKGIAGPVRAGKSRLTAALLERLSGEAHTRLRYFCSPQHTGSALYPIIGQMERAARPAHDDKTQAKLDKLMRCSQTSTSTEDAALFADMLSLANAGRYPAQELSPQQRRERTLEALTLQLVNWPDGSRF